MPRRSMLALAATLAVAAGGPLATPAAAQDIVDDTVCYVKTRDAYRCFHMGPQNRSAGNEDICITYDFAGSELCVLEEASATADEASRIAWDAAREHDQCITYDFAGSQFCVIGDTVGYGP